ncbi:MAG: DUF4080 domain-containing protein [Ruminococcaceae bacterium]|nr:DUF4080 domain-containing protein [Oscillospiraceae bacterium]
MLKAVICAINSKFVHSCLAPWYLKAMVDELCPDVYCKIIEGTINEREEKILERILESDADVVAFSAYIWNIKLVLSLAKAIKKKRSVKILLGGPEVSYNAKAVLEANPFVDYIISGEGEIPFAKLCAGVNASEIEGLCYRSNAEIVVNEPYIMIGDPPSPYTDEYLETLNGRIAYLETSRGCPYHCAFCLSGRCGGVRFFDIERSKKDILILARSGTKTVKLIDRTFNADKKRAKELFEFIINSYGKEIPQNVCFHFEIEGDILDDEIISVLASAPVGLFQMEIGLQSFNEKTLHAIDRKTNMSKLCENVKRLLAPQNIHIHIDLIAGLPYEDLNSLENSFNSAIALRPHMLQLGFLKLLYGAKLREETSESNFDYSSEPPYEVKSTKWLSCDDMEKFHIIEDFFDRFYNSRRFPSLNEYVLNLTENPFNLYTGLAFFVKNNEKSRTLDELSSLVYEYLCALDGTDKNIVRDLMATDRLSTNKMGALPEFLKIHSPKLKEYLNELEKNPKTKRKQGIKRAITLLASEKSFIYVDYDIQNPVTGKYEIFKRHNFT